MTPLKNRCCPRCGGKLFSIRIDSGVVCEFYGDGCSYFRRKTSDDDDSKQSDETVQ